MNTPFKIGISNSSWDGLFFVVVCLILVSGCQSDGLQEPFEYQTWSQYGGSADQSKYVIQDQITRENLHQLELLWVYPTQDEQSYQHSPLVVDSLMFVQARNGSLVALHAKTGEEIWIHANLQGMTRRGLSYWESEDKSDQRLLFTIHNTLQAIDARTGSSILSFGTNGYVDLRAGMGRPIEDITRAAPSTPGTIFEDLLILGASPGESYLSAPGYVRAYHVISGDHVWTFHTVPRPGEFGNDTWPKDAYRYAGGVNCWGEITIDKQRGIAYIPLGSPTYDYYGADRRGANLFGNCLLALNARTGERIWHFQTVHHDLWDYDLATAPQLMTVRINGQEIDVVSVATKQGFVFTFDRETGSPVWPIEERKVPASDMPGEETWPTQPIPSKPPPFVRQEVTVDDISDVFLSEEEVRQWKDRVARAKTGLYTPISTTETITMPGATGGANWGNSASNPSQGMMYVMSQEYPSFYQLAERVPVYGNDNQARMATVQSIERGQQLYTLHCQLCHGNSLQGTALGTPLLDIGRSIDFSHITQVVQYGLGRMPPVSSLTEDQISDIHSMIRDLSEKLVKDSVTIDGPVVANGGVTLPGELLTPRSYNRAGAEYPGGVAVPQKRYYTGYGLGFPYILKPPWSTLTAYDLNTGTIRWQIPLGEDDLALEKGHRKTGVPNGSQRNGMIVTSNGLIFSSVTNGRIYAFDAKDGSILWRTRAPCGISSIPAMYQIDGQVFLAFNATTPSSSSWNQDRSENDQGDQPSQERSYIVYALRE